MILDSQINDVVCWSSVTRFDVISPFWLIVKSLLAIF